MQGGRDLDGPILALVVLRSATRSSTARVIYVGKLKGVDKIWQYSAVDGACSFASARVFAGEKSASAVAAFLQRDVAAVYTEAGIKLREVVIDGGRGNHP